MAQRLAGKTTIVTGGASGIGAAICEGFAAEGANVVVADLNLVAATALVDKIIAAGGVATATHVDVTDRPSVRDGIVTAVERYGRIDAYFNNAGMNSPRKFLEIDEANFDTIMKVNALSVLIGIQEAATQYIAQGGGGKIVNTASIAGRTGFSSFAPYSAAKAAVISFTQSGARALAEHKITVNAFAPGVVATPLWTTLDRELTAIGEGQNGFDSMAAGILLGRPAEPEDIVPTALFLATADSDYITGQVIPIEGGMILV
jgi:meso-butanediol dehydrogenase/(S,S)-butanediol dehydrogenase/diacetyl reductase